MAWSGTREERRIYDRERYYRRKARLIEILGGKCAQCGLTDQLEFDHKDSSTKAFTIGDSWTKPLSEIEAELSKCQLLCKDCHLDKTCAEKCKLTPHGTISGYYTRKCRCEECKKAYAKYRKERRSTGREKARVAQR